MIALNLHNLMVVYGMTNLGKFEHPGAITIHLFVVTFYAGLFEDLVRQIQ